MFSNARVGTPIYVLHKQDPKLEEGKIQSASAPYPQYGTTYNAGYLQQPKMVVDLKVEIGGEVVDMQKMPADQTIADFGTNGIVVSESREALIAEVEVMRKNSQGVLDSMEHHKEILQKTQKILEVLNPQAKAEADQRRDIDALKSQMSNIEGMLTKLLNKKQKED